MLFQESPERQSFLRHMEQLMMKLVHHAPVDAGCDQMGKRLLHQSLPPVLTEGTDMTEGPGIVLFMRPTNEKRRYNVALVGRMHKLVPEGLFHKGLRAHNSDLVRNLFCSYLSNVPIRSLICTSLQLTPIDYRFENVNWYFLLFLSYSWKEM